MVTVDDDPRRFDWTSLGDSVLSILGIAGIRRDSAYAPTFPGQPGFQCLGQFRDRKGHRSTTILPSLRQCPTAHNVTGSDGMAGICPQQKHAWFHRSTGRLPVTLDFQLYTCQRTLKTA